MAEYLFERIARQIRVAGALSPLCRIRPLVITVVATAVIGSGLIACTAPTPIPTTTPRQYSAPPPMTIDTNKQYHAVLETTHGMIRIDLLAGEAPITVNSFVFLASEGFYDGVPVHRIVEGFMFQTGDPTGTGTGGPGYQFADEPVQRPYTRGIVAMANAGPNTQGSQFFIMHRDYSLPPNYTIFGQVVEGLDVVDKIAATPVTTGPGGERSQPTQEVRISRISIEEQ